MDLHNNRNVAYDTDSVFSVPSSHECVLKRLLRNQRLLQFSVLTCRMCSFNKRLFSIGSLNEPF